MIGWDDVDANLQNLVKFEKKKKKKDVEVTAVIQKQYD